MFTKRRLSSAGYLSLQRQCQAWGFAVGAIVALALTYFAPWMPQPTVQFTSWLISVAVVGTIGSIAGCYLADFLTDDEAMITPPVVTGNRGHAVEQQADIHRRDGGRPERPHSSALPPQDFVGCTRTTAATDL
ncbi:hypothetical protein [Methylibium sp.]|uniref:hypothetical protein n=1 Tax=Methylibium sp. TaxID=2067992 RepID=UPI003D09EC85